MQSKNIIQVGLAFSLIVGLAGCAPKADKASLSQTNEDLNKTSTARNDSAEKVPAATDEATKSTEIKPIQADGKAISSLSEKLTELKLDKLPDNVLICSVNDVPISMGDYRRQFKNEQQQIQASLAMNPHLKDNLIRLAREQHITLNAEEKKHLLSAANKMQAGGTKSFNKMLADNQMTKKQFDDQVLEVGLACKVANTAIEATLLDELINAAILREEAKKNGFSKEALNKYTEISKTQEYKQLIAAGGFSPDVLRDEIINNELCLKQMDKIKSEAKLTDTEMRSYYQQNKEKFKHGPLIRLSQIYISTAGQGVGTAQDVRAKLKKENPRLSDIEIDKRVADLEKEKYELVESILKRTQKGEDFASLANQYSEDLDKNKEKNGGDLGFQEESKLNKDFATKISNVPVGAVAKEVIVSPFGYHIFKVTAKEGPGYYKFEEVKDELKPLLAEQKGQQAVNNWLTEERKQAKIVISPEIQNALTSNMLPKRELVASRPANTKHTTTKK